MVRRRLLLELIDAQSQEINRAKRFARVAQIRKRLEEDAARPIMGWRLDYFTDAGSVAGPVSAHESRAARWRDDDYSIARIADTMRSRSGSTASSSGGANGTGTPGFPSRRGAALSAPKTRSVTSAISSPWMPHVR